MSCPTAASSLKPTWQRPLEDALYALREQRGTDLYPKPAQEYLNDWAAKDKA